MDKPCEWPIEKYARLKSTQTKDGKQWDTLETSQGRSLVLSLTKNGVLKLLSSGMLLEYWNLRQTRDMRVLKKDHSLLFLCRAKSVNRKWRVMFSGGGPGVAEDRCNHCLRAIHALLPAVNPPPIPSSQSHTSQTLQSHTSQPLPTLQSHQQPLPTLQPQTNQTKPMPTLQAHTNQTKPMPTLQAHTSQTMPTLQSHTSQAMPTLQSHIPQPPPSLPLTQTIQPPQTQVPWSVFPSSVPPQSLLTSSSFPPPHSTQTTSLLTLPQLPSTSQAKIMPLKPQPISLLPSNANIYSSYHEGIINTGSDQLLGIPPSGLHSQSLVRPPNFALQYLHQAGSLGGNILTGGNVFVPTPEPGAATTITPAVKSKKGKGKDVKGKKAKKDSITPTPSQNDTNQTEVSWPPNQDTITDSLTPGDDASQELKDIVMMVLRDPGLPNLVEVVHSIISNM